MAKEIENQMNIIKRKTKSERSYSTDDEEQNFTSVPLPVVKKKRSKKQKRESSDSDDSLLSLIHI